MAWSQLVPKTELRPKKKKQPRSSAWSLCLHGGIKSIYSFTFLFFSCSHVISFSFSSWDVMAASSTAAEPERSKQEGSAWETTSSLCPLLVSYVNKTQSASISQSPSSTCWGGSWSSLFWWCWRRESETEKGHTQSETHRRTKTTTDET